VPEAAPNHGRRGLIHVPVGSSEHEILRQVIPDEFDIRVLSSADRFEDVSNEINSIVIDQL